MKKKTTLYLVQAALIAAMYVALTYLSNMAGLWEVRFSEALCILPYFTGAAVPGLAVGCFIANLIGSPIALDWIVGTAATLLAALWTSKLKRRWLAPMPPVLCNMVIVGAEIAWFEGGFTSAFFPSWVFNAATVGLGELLACYILGMLLIGILPRIPYFRGMIPEERLSVTAAQLAR